MKRIEKSGSLFPPAARGAKISLTVDGRQIGAYQGETVASALLAAGITTLRLSAKNAEPRGVYCGMGVCYECLVTINGVHAQRACVTPAEDGMVIETCKEAEL
ncbi:MAG: (2Fe-2S)-binding protein [Chloroflexi bacterium]|nr:(2Fe-2S)-binding protein [Chloroflexota bacterium]